MCHVPLGAMADRMLLPRRDALLLRVTADSTRDSARAVPVARARITQRQASGGSGRFRLPASAFRLRFRAAYS